MRNTIDTLTPQRTRRHGQRMTAEERKQVQRKFLDAFGRTANITAACMQAGISRQTVYVWQEHYTEFGLEFQEANKRANDVLFGEAWRRATQGDESYVVSAGKLVYGPDGKPLMERKRSDRLLELLLKARMPEFRDKQQVEVSGPGGGPIQHQLVHALAQLPPEQLDMLDQASRIVDEAVKHGS